MSEVQIIDRNVLLRTKLLGLPRESHLVVRVDNNQLTFALEVKQERPPVAPAPPQASPTSVPLTEMQVNILLQLETLSRSR